MASPSRPLRQDLLAPSLFDWLPGHRAAQRRAQASRLALAELPQRLAELDRDLIRLAALAQVAEQPNAAAVARRSTITARLREGLGYGERLAARCGDQEIASGWRVVRAAVDSALLLAPGPQRVARLRAAAGRCEQLRLQVEEKLGASATDGQRSAA